MDRGRFYNLTAKLAFCLMGIDTWLLVVVNHQLFYVLKIITVFIYLLAIVSVKWKINNLMSHLAFVVICIMAYSQCGDQQLLYLPVVLMAMSRVNPREIAQMDLLIKLVCMLLVGVLWLFSVVPDFSTVQFVSESIRKRYTFGYFNPNGFYFGIYILCIDILVLFRNRLTSKYIIAIIVIGILFGQLTYCRTGMIVLIITVFMLTIGKEKLFNKKCNIIKFILTWGLPAGYLLTFLLVIMYRNGSVLAREISTLMTGRIRFASDFMERYRILLLGQRITKVSGLEALQTNTYARTLDNFYAYSILAYGVLFCIVLTAVYVRTQRRLLRTNEYVLAIALFVITIYSMTESVFISCESNSWVVLLCLGFSKNMGGDWLRQT